MDWLSAVALMRKGKHVCRASQQKKTLIGHTPNNTPIYDCGTESIFLAAAWTVDNQAVFVFMGSESKTMFLPMDHHTEATDWIEYKES
jgi:hypothetical protein